MELNEIILLSMTVVLLIFVILRLKQLQRIAKIELEIASLTFAGIKKRRMKEILE
jgi:hypothetical protein